MIATLRCKLQTSTYQHRALSILFYSSLFIHYEAPFLRPLDSLDLKMPKTVSITSGSPFFPSSKLLSTKREKIIKMIKINNNERLCFCQSPLKKSRGLMINLRYGIEKFITYRQSLSKKPPSPYLLFILFQPRFPPFHKRKKEKKK